MKFVSLFLQCPHEECCSTPQSLGRCFPYSVFNLGIPTEAGFASINLLELLQSVVCGLGNTIKSAKVKELESRKHILCLLITISN